MRGNVSVLAQVDAKALAQQILAHVNVPVIVVAVAVLVLAVVLLVLRRRSRARSGGREISPGALVRIWKTFLSQIPGEFRRYVLHFQSFVVLGEAGSGKSLLIAKYTDWKGQAAQFYPSYVADPLLQLYLGSRALVQEVPAVLLADTSAKARTALTRVWAKVGKKRAPVAVVTVSAAQLREATPEALRTQAQTIRGKLNVLSRLANKPIETRVVLTHVDQVEGYLAFSEFVEKQEIPHRIQLDPAQPGLGLSTCLAPYEEYLALALTTLPAKSYLKVLTFLNKAPATFENLGLLLKALRESDPRSFEPDVKALYLTSHTSGSPSAVSNPFETSWTAHGEAIESAVSTRHRIVTRVLVVLGLAWLLAGFFHERARLSDATDALAKFDKEGKAETAVETEQAIIRFASGQDRSALASTLLPSYTRAAAATIRARFAALIREKELRPIERELRTAANPQEKALYLLGLLYASPSTKLGSLVLAGRAEWAKVLGLSENVVTAYVNESDEPWQGTVALGELPYERRVTPATQPEAWLSLFAELQGVLAGRSTSAEQLARLQEAAGQLREGLAAARRKHTTTEIFHYLEADPRFDKRPFQKYVDDLRLPRWLLTQQQPFDDLVEVILDARMVVPSLAKHTLAELNYHLQAIPELADVQGKTIQITLEEKVHSFDTGRWQRVLNNGKARTLVQRFVQDHQQQKDSSILIQDAASYNDVVMRPPTNSGYLFPGKGTVAGVYTKAAYEREVVPQIAKFEAIYPKLDLDREVHDELRNLVSSAVEAYAAAYDTQWRTYYKSWQVQADQLDQLKIILGQVKLPASRFQEFFQTVVDNTTLEPNNSPYLRPILDRAEAFRKLGQLLATPGPKVPSELENYRSIVGRILQDLESPGAAEPPKDAADKGDIRKRPPDFVEGLTPLARASVAILQDDRDNYERLTETWLRAAGVVEPWSEPFLQPIRQLHRLGIADLQKSLRDRWTRRVRSQVLPLLDRFPFNKRAPQDATPNDLNDVLNPTNGLFWVAFRSLVAPVCELQGSTWHPVRGLETGFAWPDDLFPLVNQLALLTRTLWDKDVVPQPLTLEVQAEPLPVPIQGRPEVVLAFLNSGKNTVYAFNQRATWQTLKVEWSTRTAAQVGIQLGDPETNEKSNRVVTEPESTWSFFRLLLRDNQSDKGTLTWNLSEGVAEFPPNLIRFSFKGDPWSLFSAPVSQDKGVEKNDGK